MSYRDSTSFRESYQNFSFKNKLFEIGDYLFKRIGGSCLHMGFKDYPLIIYLDVRPDHQGKGVGRFL